MSAHRETGWRCVKELVMRRSVGKSEEEPLHPAPQLLLCDFRVRSQTKQEDEGMEMICYQKENRVFRRMFHHRHGCMSRNLQPSCSEVWEGWGTPSAESRGDGTGRN